MGLRRAIIKGETVAGEETSTQTGLGAPTREGEGLAKETDKVPRLS